MRDDEVWQAVSLGCFADVPREVMQAFLKRGQVVEARAGSVVRRPGDGARICVLIDGLLRVHLTSNDGQQLTVRYVRAGDVLGAAQVFEPMESVHILALVRTRAWSVPLDHVRDLILAEPALLQVVARQSAALVSELMEELAELSFRSFRQRVARHLLDAAEPDEDGQLVCHLNQRQLGEAVGSLREAVARVLRAFRETGTIETGGGRITITDCETLFRETEA